MRQHDDYNALWRRRLRAFERSTLTVPEFCQQEGVSTTSFYKWRMRIEGRREQPSLVELVEVGDEARAIEIVARGVVVRVGKGFDHDTLGRVLDLIFERK